MPQSKITVNASVGSNTALPLNTLVALDNLNTGGELTYNWSILDQPPGAADNLSAPTAQNPFFTPKKEGTYLLRLIVNQGLVSEQEDRVVCGVLQLKTLQRIPAAGETTEADSADGWATANNAMLRSMDALLSDPGIFVGVNASGGTLTRGDVLKAVASSTIKATLPGQEIVPGMAKALATLTANVDEPLVVCEGTVAGASSVPNGALMKMRFLGRYAGATSGAPAAVGDPVYVSDTGTLSLTEGTIRRKVGSAMTAGTTYDVWFAGVGGEDITPVDRRYLIYGAPGSLTNAFRVDGPSNASGITGGVPVTLKQADDVTKTLLLKRNSSSGQEMLEVQTEGGAALAKIDALGNVSTDADYKYLTAKSYVTYIPATALLPRVPTTAPASFQPGLVNGVTFWGNTAQNNANPPQTLAGALQGIPNGAVLTGLRVCLGNNSGSSKNFDVYLLKGAVTATGFGPSVSLITTNPTTQAVPATTAEAWYTIPIVAASVIPSSGQTSLAIAFPDAAGVADDLVLWGVEVTYTIADNKQSF